MKKEKLTVPIYKQTTTEQDTQNKELNLFKKQGLIWRIRYNLFKKNKLRTVQVNMEMRNGDNQSFLIFLEKENNFIYRKGVYVWNETQKQYNRSTGFYFNNYHEDCSIPITTKINLDEIRTAISEIDEDNIEYALNPRVVLRFLKSNIQDLILRGGALQNLMTFMKIILIIIVIIVGVHLILFMYKTGMFDKVTNLV